MKIKLLKSIKKVSKREFRQCFFIKNVIQVFSKNLSETFFQYKMTLLSFIVQPFVIIFKTFQMTKFHLVFAWILFNKFLHNRFFKKFFTIFDFSTISNKTFLLFFSISKSQSPSSPLNLVVYKKTRRNEIEFRMIDRGCRLTVSS